MEVWYSLFRHTPLGWDDSPPQMSCIGNTLPGDGSIVYSATLLWAGILRISNPVEGNKNGGAV